MRCREGAKEGDTRGRMEEWSSTNYSGKLGEQQVLGRMGSSGLDTSSLEFREQA